MEDCCPVNKTNEKNLDEPRCAVRVRTHAKCSADVASGQRSSKSEMRMLFVYVHILHTQDHWIQLKSYKFLSYTEGGIGNDFGVVLGWYWVVLGGIGEHVAHVQSNGRGAECIGNTWFY